MSVRQQIRQIVDELRDGYDYVRDPHGWEQRIRDTQRARVADRPAMYQLARGKFIIHPELLPDLAHHFVGQITGIAGLGDPNVSAVAKLHGVLRTLGVDVYVSQFAVNPAPAGGWPDVIPLDRPRLRP